MARNKFDVDESLESPFDAGHLKLTLHYIARHKWKMLLALLLSGIASVIGLLSPKITERVMPVRDGLVSVHTSRNRVLAWPTWASSASASSSPSCVRA